MKKFSIVGILLMFILLLGACSTSKQTEEATTEAKVEEEKIVVDYGQGLTKEGLLDGITPEDYVTVCDYENIEIPEKEIEVTEEEIKSQTLPILSNYGIYDQVIKKGDVVNLDYKGTLDGETFDGGTATNQFLEIGSGSFIDGFEDQLIGHSPGEEPFDINVTFPEKYASADLAGKDAVFTVTINYILPELNDEFVAKYYSEDLGISTVKEFQSKIEENLAVKKRNEYIWNYLLTNSTFQELPEELVEKRLDVALDSLRLNYDYYGYNDEQIMQMYNVTSMDDIREQLRAETETSVKTYLITSQIATKENLSVDDEAIDKYIGKDNVDGYYEEYGKPYVHAQILVSMISDFVGEKASLK